MNTEGLTSYFEYIEGEGTLQGLDVLRNMTDISALGVAHAINDIPWETLVTIELGRQAQWMRQRQRSLDSDAFEINLRMFVRGWDVRREDITEYTPVIEAQDRFVQRLKDYLS